ncbi:MAG: hypothetical protein P4L22_02040 [Candidatus Babeliales bacterium]|nr:hypothetical protein [Candidatus Babeliales bacterium]
MNKLIKYRNPYLSGCLSALTGGLYNIYWVLSTKKEINNLGGNIYSIFLYLIPFFYLCIRFFLSKYINFTEYYYSLNWVVFFFPLLFWYSYISNFVKYFLLQNSRFIELKWFALSLTIPVTLSVLTPIFVTAFIIFIFNINDSLLELAQYIKDLLNTEIFTYQAILFLIFKWLFFSVFLLILFIPQIIIQYYLNKK